MPGSNVNSVRLATVAALALGCVPATNIKASEPAKAQDESTINWTREREFWAFRPPVAPTLPSVRNKRWPRQPLDWFVLARLEASGTEPALHADKRTLIRRVTFDLTGLPPTPEAVARFLRDDRADAYERLVDSLLNSPRFGERLASLWLPLARYAEDQAHQVGKDTTMFYPRAHRYREWVIGAFNRDVPYDQFLRLQLAADKLNATEELAALGFLGLGPKYYNRNRIEVMADEWEDRVDTVTRTMLGLTVGCARCHDHKFDPITMQDYYALAGVFASTRMVNKTPDGKKVEGKVEADKMPAGTLHLVEDGDAKDLNVFRRGNVENPGPVAERRFLQVLSRGEPEKFKDGSGRSELAAAITGRQNPLTARVMVNRLWALCFGAPLVVTPSNFGHSGEPPSYPALLDDLAVRFMDQDWSIKAMLREFVLSATYRQASRRTMEVDADRIAANAGDGGKGSATISPMPHRRLSVEQWRDQVLFVSGELDLAAGESLELDDPGNRRRTLHARISRLKLNDLLMQFDYPDANVHAERRASTTTPMLKLFILNSPFMLERARAFATRVTREAQDNEQARIELAYQLLFSREPVEQELQLAKEFLAKPAPAATPRWVQYAQMLLASNEALYVD